MKLSKWVLLTGALLSYPCFGQDVTRDYSLPQLIQKVKTANFEVRSKAETVYQAKKDIHVRIGRLLPGLHFGAILAGVEGNYVSLASSLLGFLFPSNWFRWKESKALYWAERKSYSSLVANQMNAVETLGLRVHLAKTFLRLYEFHLQEVDKILKQARVRTEWGEEPKDLILQMENLKFLLLNDHQLLKNSLLQQYADLAHGVGLPLSERKSFQLASMDLPDLSQEDELDPQDFLPEVLKRSYELSTFQYLINASKSAWRTRYFEFLSPGGDQDGSLGPGYKSYLEIGRSKTKQIRVKSQEMASNLQQTLIKAVDGHNMSLRLYNVNGQGFKKASEWVHLLQQRFYEEGTYNAVSFVKAMKTLFKFQAQLAGAQHQYLISKAQMNRLLLNSPFYEDLDQTLSKKTRKRGFWRSLFRR